MSTRTKPERDAVLVSWVSYRDYADPLITALDNSPLRGRVHTLYLCVRIPTGPEAEKDRAALAKTRRDLKGKLGPKVCPDIEVRRWRTEAPPTAHDAIHAFAEQTLRHVRAAHPSAPIYIHMSPGTPGMHAVWLVLGSTGFLDELHLIQTTPKQFLRPGEPPVRSVGLTLDTWLQRYRAATPDRSVGDDDGQLWDPTAVRSEPLKRLFQAIARWAPLRVPVLLLGERGSGKTTIANLIRARSPFQAAKTTATPVVVCGQFAANPELARSELFGHVKGAFTGAEKDHTGLLERADGDTLFLDEVAHLDLRTQHLLLAAIEGRGFSRLGEVAVRHSSFRLLCATNRTVADLRAGALEPDFLDRIAVAVLDVPSLRDCRDDLAAAWSKVLRRAVARTGVRVDRWERFQTDQGLLDGIRAHPLPGNFRSLQRAAFHLLAHRHEGGSDADCVAAALAALAGGAVEAENTGGQPTLPLAEGQLDALLDGEAYRWLTLAMRRAGGNKTDAAQLLGLPRKTFANRWRRFGGK